MLREDANCYGDIASANDLPAGWTDAVLGLRLRLAQPVTAARPAAFLRPTPPSCERRLPRSVKDLDGRTPQGAAIVRVSNAPYMLCICQKRRMSPLPASSAAQTAAAAAADPTTNQVFTGPTSYS